MKNSSVKKKPSISNPDTYQWVKIAIIALGVIAGLYLISGAINLVKRAAAPTASLALTGSYSVNIGDEFTVPLNLNTDNNQIWGTDIRIIFDKDKLQLTALNPLARQNSTLKTFAPIDSGNNFNSTSVLNTANSSGIIEFSAVTADLTNQTVTAPFSGTAALASLTFKALAGGTANISFDYNSGSTTDSNIVPAGNDLTDLLGKVTNLSITINSSQQNPSPTTAPSAGGSSPTPGINPETVYIRFGVKLAGAEKTPEIKVRLTVKDPLKVIENANSNTVDACNNPGTGVKFYKDIPLEADGNGIYHPKPGGKFTTENGDTLISTEGWIPLPGLIWGNKYSLSVKGPKHRNISMVDNKILSKGNPSSQNFDWTTSPLEPGDLPNPNNNKAQDCIINSIDFSLIISRMAKIDQENLDIADVNYDGVVNGNDVSQVINTLSVKQDD